MCVHYHPMAPAEFAREIRGLCARSRGPAEIKSKLREWAAAWEAGDPTSFTTPRIEDALSALIIISLANTAFQIGPFARTYPPRRDVELIDLGGAFPALFLVSAIVTSVEDANRRSVLDAYARAEIVRDVTSIRELTGW